MEKRVLLSKSLGRTVCVIGLGYTGLPTATLLSLSGWDVVGVDVKESTVTSVNNGEVPFVEPGLQESVRKAVFDGCLQAQTEVIGASNFIVAVPTPFKDDYSLDSSYILDAADNLSAVLNGGELIVLESTSPPGTTRMLADYLIERRPDLTLAANQPNSIYLAHCPERVLPGNVMHELVSNDRVIGGVTPEAGQRARSLYESFTKGKIVVTDADTAEMSKLAENAFRDVNIAFANELSIICDQLGINVWDMIAIANRHPRVDILTPGPGVGGHCIAVDPWFIVSASPRHSRLIRTAREVNDSKPSYIADQVTAAAGNRERVNVAALGATFKANIDDVRQSPAVSVISQVAQRLPGGSVKVVDPWIEHLPEELGRFHNVKKVSLKEAVLNVDVIMLLVDHDEFKSLDPTVFETARIIDTRGIWATRD